jgi:hypothetical protein
MGQAAVILTSSYSLTVLIACAPFGNRNVFYNLLAVNHVDTTGGPASACAFVARCCRRWSC